MDPQCLGLHARDPCRRDQGDRRTGEHDDQNPERESRGHRKPNLEVGGELFAAPEGWVQQEEGAYGLHASATDNGFGVTALRFKIDGKPVASKEQSCAAGRCSASISASVNVKELAAGAHQVEVVATDGAGNATVREWTINVDPEGHITTAELWRLLKQRKKRGEHLVTSQNGGLEGTVAGLGVEAAGSADFRATGTSVPLTISRDPSQGFELEVLAQGQLGPPCDEATPKQPDPGEGSGALPPDEPVFLEEKEKEEESCP